MSTCPKSIIITPSNNPVDRLDVSVSLLENDTVKIQIPSCFNGQTCWIVRFKKRKNNPPILRGPALMKKVMVDEILSPVKRLDELPGIWKDINSAIDEGLKDAVEVGPKRIRPLRRCRELLDLELPLDKAKSSYIYIDFPGQVMDGPDYYLIDIPLFIDRVLQQGRNETQ
jgi:hypothetical protein